MATTDGIRKAFSLLIAAGYKFPKESQPRETRDIWLSVMEGVSDEALEAGVMRYCESDDTYWPTVGVLRTRITGGYKPATYYSVPDDDGPVATPEEIRAAWSEYLDLDDLKRRDSARRARNNGEQ